ncbi:hypothetical protein ACOWOE_01535 [Helicobacter pylori]
MFGITCQKRINGLLVNDYSKTKEALILETIEPYFVRAKRNFTYDPQDILIECEYTAEQKKLIKLILKGGLENYVSGGVKGASVGTGNFLVKTEGAIGNAVNNIKNRASQPENIRTSVGFVNVGSKSTR